MSGRWLLDAATLLRVSRQVISKHIALRNHQFDDYEKTSSLVKAVKSQTDRVTLTIKAAGVLTGRLNGLRPQYSPTSQPRTGTIAGVSVQSQQRSLAGDREKPSNHEGLEQDHFYRKSEDNSADQPTPTNSLEIQQEDAKRSPLPDGSIPPTDSDLPEISRQLDCFSELQKSVPAKYPLPGESGIIGSECEHVLKPEASGRSSISEPVPSGVSLDPEAQEPHGQTEAQIPAKAAEPLNPIELSSKNRSTSRSELGIDQNEDIFYTPQPTSSLVHSSLPRVKIPEFTKNAQESDERVPDKGINQDVYYSGKSAAIDRPLFGLQAETDQEAMSEDIYAEIFHSPEVAKLLGGGKRKGGPARAVNVEKHKNSPTTEIKRPHVREKDAFRVRDQIPKQDEAVSPSNDKPASSASEVRKQDSEIYDLAAEAAKDTHVDQLTERKVSRHSIHTRWLVLIG